MTNENKTPEAKLADWTEMKSKIKARFGKLTDSAIDSLKGNLEALPNTLRQVYGYGKDESARELATFKTSLSSPISPPENPLTAVADVPAPSAGTEITAPVADATKVA